MTKQIHVNVLNGHVKWGRQAFDSRLLRFVTFEKKKQTSEKKLPSTLEMGPSTLDPRQKDRLSLHVSFL